MKGRHGATSSLRRARPILITGGAGFIGSNLADRLAHDGHDVLIFDALIRPGVERNLAWLKARHGARITSIIGDIRDVDAVNRVAREACAVFHFAAQVAVTTSLADPLADFETNAGGTLALLEALRARPLPPPLIFASTNKVYGDLSDLTIVEEDDRYVPAELRLRNHGIAEDRMLDFHSPYGCSKGAADQYVLDYARSFGLKTAVLRMSCIYGERQLGTEDQGWVAHFLRRALAGEPITIYGTGRQVRDLLHVGDAISAYIAAWRNIDAVAGTAFNLGGGPANAVSLMQVISYIETLLGHRIHLQFEDWRRGDQKFFVADTSRARAALDLPRPRDWRDGLSGLAAWLQSERIPPLPTHSPDVVLAPALSVAR